MSSARRLYRLQLALALAGAGAVLAAVAVALTRIAPGVPSARELLAACQAVVPLEPGVGLLVVLVLVSVGLVAAFLGLRSIWRQVRTQRAFLRTLHAVGDREIARTTVTLFDGARPEAFCAGLLRPRIYVSSAAVRLLTPSELAAVVAHEAHHRSRRDPLRIVVARALAYAFFFMPALRHLSERYGQLAELAADEAAARTEGREALASAMLRFGERNGEAAPVVGIAPERVEHLLGAAPRWRLPLSILAGSLVVFAGLVSLVLTAPALIDSESVSLAAVVAQSCMVAMTLAPIAIAASALWLGRSWLRPA